MTSVADVAIIGGSGFYSLFEEGEQFYPETPYGFPSGPITVANAGGKRVAFLPRHGANHELPAHSIPYRANLYALAELGAKQVLAPCAVGSLRVENGPGTLVVPDQLVDRTTGRKQTYFDRFDGPSTHVSFADPYCAAMRSTSIDQAREQGWHCVDGGTMVVIDGPRFSTRAESRWYAAQGWSLINMTGHPEAVLAREMAMCYCALALVTDLDAGLATGSGVTEAEVYAVFAAHTERLRTLLVDVVADLPPAQACTDCT